MKIRSLEPEIMDGGDATPAVARRFHRDLALIHRLMGNWEIILDRLGEGAVPNSVMDIGCGDGALLQRIHQKLGVPDVTGVDLKPPECAMEGVPVIVADATEDALPRCDAAVSVMVLHHFTDEQVVRMIRNVGRYANRLICLDPVRHPLPLILYSALICPLLSHVGAADGRLSIRRSFRKDELERLVKEAIAGTGATFEHWVSPVYARQVIDIRWPAPG